MNISAQHFNDLFQEYTHGNAQYQRSMELLVTQQFAICNHLNWGGSICKIPRVDEAFNKLPWPWHFANDGNLVPKPGDSENITCSAQVGHLAATRSNIPMIIPHWSLAQKHKHTNQTHVASVISEYKTERVDRFGIAQCV